MLINGNGPSGTSGDRQLSNGPGGEGGEGYGAGGGGGGYLNTVSPSARPGGAGANGVVYIEWDEN